MWKAFEKQIKIIKDQGKEQADTLKTLKPEELEAIEDKYNYKHNKTFYELSNVFYMSFLICTTLIKKSDFNSLIY